MSTETLQRKVNLSLDADVYQDLEAVARQEHRSVPQTAQQLLQDGLRLRQTMTEMTGEVSSTQIAAIAIAGGAFDWLADEPDLYDDTSGEPV